DTAERDVVQLVLRREPEAAVLHAEVTEDAAVVVIVAAAVVTGAAFRCLLLAARTARSVRDIRAGVGTVVENGVAHHHDSTPATLELRLADARHDDRLKRRTVGDDLAVARYEERRATHASA